MKRLGISSPVVLLVALWRATVWGQCGPAPTPLPVPSVSLSVPAQNFIGENLTFTATFDNTSTTPGYGPFIDLIFPYNGADGAAGTATADGINFVGATYLGAAVTATVLTFPAGPGCVTHPYAVDSSGVPLQVCGTRGDKLVVLQLPFGSFTGPQTPAVVTVNATLSNLADLNTPLTIRGRAGFQYGYDALNDPACDPSILGPNLPNDASSNSATWSQSGSTTPILLKLTKIYIGPEDETATGPNYPRQYTINIDIANGQTITNFDVIDKLPNNLAFLSVVSSSPAGATVAATPPVGVAVNPPNNRVDVHFNSVTGTLGSSDVTVTFSFFVPRLDGNGASILDPVRGGCVQSINDALATGTWAPIDVRDPTLALLSDDTPQDHIIKVCAIVIQKGVTVVSDVSPAGPSPGDTLEYTYDFQVSDFFTMGGAGPFPGTINIADVVGDGQHFDSGFAPTLSVTDRGGSTVGTFAAGGNLVVDASQRTTCGNGSTTLTFDVSQQLIDIATGHPDGILQGGRALAPDAGPATGTITYRTVVDEAYACTVPSGNQQLNGNDFISNSVVISGAVLDNSTLVPTGFNSLEDSGAGVQIAVGLLSKEVYARNGVIGPVTQFAAGDDITYRIRRTLPLSDIEDFSLTDYVPLPVLRVDDPDADLIAGPAWSFDPTVSAATPPPGTAKFGPNDSFFALSGIVPTVTTDTVGNSLNVSYGTYDDPTNSTTLIDVLFTIRVRTDPFADGLFLTNQVHDSEQNSFVSPTAQNAIVQFQLTEPVLNIKKGVIATDSSSGTFSPATVGPVAFTAPGGGCPRFAGTINSNGLAATPINSNLSGIDAGDRATFAMVVENTGQGLYGAFDVRVRDTLPAGFAIPGGGLNLCVTDGTGAAIPFSTLGAGLFDVAGGIELTDPGPSNGAIGAYSATAGTNLAIITFDLVADTTVQPSQQISDTATLFNYASREGGADFTTTDLTDQATVTMAPPSIAKTIQSIAPNGAGGSNVTAGDIVTYRLRVTLPEGTTPALTLDDTLPAGFQFVAGSVAVDTTGFAGTVTTTPTVSAGPPIDIQFGDVTVSADNVTTNNSFIVTLQAQVLDSGANSGGQTKTNTVNLSFTGHPNAATSSVSTVFQEPRLTLTKAMNPSAPDANDTVTITLTVRNTGSSPAYDVSVSDTLPGTLFDLTALTSVNEGTTPADFTFGYSSPTVTYTPNGGFSSLAVGATRTFTFTAKVRSDVVTGSAYQNTAGTTGDSQNGVVIQQRTTTANGSATANVPSSQASKSIIATSENSTDPGDVNLNANPPVAIGEVLTFRLTYTIPEGTTNNVTLSDVLPSGLTHIAGSAFLDRNSAALTTTSDPGSINSNTPGTPVAVTLSGTTGTISLALGTVTNSDNNNATAETFSLTLQAVVNNSVTNNAGTSLSDTARLTFTNALGATQTVNSAARTVHVAEPTVQVTKSANPTTAAGGDLITFTLIVANGAAGANAASAFEWTLTDTLPAVYQSPSVTGINVGATGAAAAASFTGNTLNGTIDQLDPGESITITYTATLSPAAPFGQVVTNTATVATTSLPGTNGSGGVTPGAAGSGTGERTAAGGVNDLTASSTASVTVTVPTLSKTTVAPQSFYAIGETPTFQITLGVPQGTTTNLVVSDVLPAGLAFQAGSLTATLPPSVTSTTGSSPLTEGSAGFFSQTGNTLSFNFGNVTATSGATIVITYTTVVQDVITNQDGTILTNTVSMTFDDPNNPGQHLSVGPVVNASPVRVGEPNLTMAKVITAGATGSDAGNTVSWQVQIQNTGHTTAYQVDWRDVLPDGLFQISNVVVATSGGNVFLNNTGTGVVSTDAVVSTTANTNDTVSLPLVQIDAGATVTVSFDAVLMNTVTPGEVLNNTTRASYTSLVNGGRDNSSNPGNVDDDDNSVLNNYEESASQALTVATLVAIDKNINPTTYTIGQTLTYTLRVDLNEGVIPNMVVTDVLPAGLTYVSHSIAFGHMAILPGNAGFDTNIGVGQIVRFNFGDVTNPADGDAADDFITIDLTVQVDNVGGNENGTVLKNGEAASGSPVYVQFGTGSPTQVNFDHDAGTPGAQGLPITIVEPDLAVTKVASPTSQSLGDVVTFTITVQHTASSTADAFDLVLTDVLPAGLTYVDGSATLPAADVTVAGQNLQFTIAALTQLAGNTSFAYQARVDTDAAVGVSLTNNLNLTWASLAGSNGAADSGRTGSDGVGGLNDYSATSQAAVTPNANAFVRATKTVADLSGTTVAPGDTLEYTVAVNNAGPAVTGVVFTDSMPTSTTYVPGSISVNGTAQTDAVDADAADFNVTTANSVTVNIGSMLPGATVTIRFRVTVDALTPNGQIISNQGSVNSDQTVPTPTDADGNPANGAQPTNVVVGQTPTAGLRADKSVQLTADAAPTGTINAGDTVTYTITLTNTGGISLSNVSFADTVPSGPPGVAVNSITTTQGTAPSASNVISIPDIGTIPPGGSVVIAISGVVNGAGTISNQGTASSTETGSVQTDGDPDPTNGAQPTTFQAVGAGVAGTPLLDPFKTMTFFDSNGDGVVNPGETIRYTVVVQNTGSATATNVMLSDPLPANLNLIAGSVTSSQGAVVSEADPITVNLADLAPGGTATVSMDFTVDPAATTGTVITNQATVTDGQGDNVPSNNASFTVAQPFELTIDKVGDPDPVVAGNMLTYTIDYSNTGDSTAPRPVVLESYDPNVTFVSAVPAPDVGTNNRWTLADLAPADSGEIVVRVAVPDSLPAGSTIANNASITSGASAASAQAFNQSSPQRCFSIRASDSDLFAGDRHPGTLIRIRITYAAPCFGTYYALLQDDLPAGLTFVSAGNKGTFSNGTLTWNIINRRTGSVSFIARINSDLVPGVHVQNTATIFDSIGNFAQSVELIRTLRPHPNPPQTLSLTARAPSSVRAGRSMRVTFNYKHLSLGGQVAVLLAPNESLVSTRPAPSSIGGGGVPIWTGDALRLPNGSIVLTVQVAPTVSSGTVLTHSAVVTDLSGNSRTASASVSVR